MAKKAKKKGIRYWKEKAWDEFSKLTRLDSALKTTGTKTDVVCCSCGKRYPAFGKGCVQAGHFVPGRGNAILFEEDGCHGQCYNCNIRLKGNTLNYLDFMLANHGQARVDRLRALDKTIVKFTVSELIEKRDSYKQRYEALLKGETQ